LTGLQYDRFRDWADGQFTKGSKGATNLDLLTRAALEQTVGTQMYPGIEVYWIAKDPKMYDKEKNPVNPPFRFNHAGVGDQPAVQPGDLTARLSLPWQSGFSLCNTHWYDFREVDSMEFYLCVIKVADCSS
jgi:L-lysine epsilon oxidase C-terminal domain